MTDWSERDSGAAKHAPTGGATGSTPWAPEHAPQARGAERTAGPHGAERTAESHGEQRTAGTNGERELPGLAGEEHLHERSNTPVVVMIVALVALLVTLGAVGFLVSRQTGPSTPGATLTPEPTGVPALPVTAGEYSRDPGDPPAPSEFGVDRSMQTASAIYRRGGQPALIAVGARPVNDPQALLNQIKANAIRPVGDAWCGREQSKDLDVCVVHRGQTGMLVVGLRSQPAEELAGAAHAILESTK